MNCLTPRQRDRLLAKHQKQDPFAAGIYWGDGGPQPLSVVDAETRLGMVREFTLSECRRALRRRDLQKTVRVAIERRIRKLERAEAQS